MAGHWIKRYVNRKAFLANCFLIGFTLDEMQEGLLEVCRLNVSKRQIAYELIEIINYYREMVYTADRKGKRILVVADSEVMSMKEFEREVNEVGYPKAASSAFPMKLHYIDKKKVPEFLEKMETIPVG